MVIVTIFFGGAEPEIYEGDDDGTWVSPFFTVCFGLILNPTYFPGVTLLQCRELQQWSMANKKWQKQEEQQDLTSVM